MTEALLDVRRLDKRFGGLHVTRDVTLAVRGAEIHALIGPNGAGKTTLVNQLCGEIAPDSGAIIFDGIDVTRMAVAARSELGLARTFQIASVFSDFTVIENIVFSLRAQNKEALRFWSLKVADQIYRERALAVLRDVGLEPRAEERAANLSYGEMRQLEIATALASGPRLLFLDEPMAGMGTDDSARLLKFLSSIKGRFPMLLIEHDMPTVFSLADRITVLVEGRIAITGSPDEVRLDPTVRKAYLGSKSRFQ